ncbi:hypothetical protein GVK96_01120 [Enterococcus hirae]|uniref:hypothetical protein n=1 Tax=Enterococcus hirae TaxID=1354 RepID=UPI001377B6CB|nr:hypothetical protein [Enterococcus hirae]NBA38121.1 hypothetical protein [Enterococcus hirae]
MFKLLGCLFVISVFASLMKASICNYITQLSIESQNQHQQLAETNLLYLEQIEKRLDKLKSEIESKNESLRAQNHALEQENNRLEQENRRLESEKKQIQVAIDQLTQKWIPKPSAGDGNKLKR